jgi:hypothetical protein
MRLSIVSRNLFRVADYYKLYRFLAGFELQVGLLRQLIGQRRQGSFNKVWGRL